MAASTAATETARSRAESVDKTAEAFESVEIVADAHARYRRQRAIALGLRLRARRSLEEEWEAVAGEEHEIANQIIRNHNATSETRKRVSHAT